MKFPKDGKGKLPVELKKNLYAFSSAKTYAQLEAINDLLYNKEGKLRPFNEFSQLAKKTGHQYNKNYLQAEWQTARTAAQMAQKWEKLQENKDIFPNLKYRTVGDERVRRDHERLNGIVKPIDDAFWSKYYPPLDWRCRCDVVATAEDITEHKENDLPKPVLKGNVGKDKEIFTQKGTFFKLARTNENAVRNIELAKLNAPYETAYKSKSGKKVEVSIYADSKDLEDNLRIGEVITDSLKINIFIRPHLDGRIVKGFKNPEFLINNKLAELKIPESINYKKVLSKANAQECEIVIIDLSKNNDSIENAYHLINNVLKRNDVHPYINEVVIISKDAKEVKIYNRKKQD